MPDLFGKVFYKRQASKTRFNTDQPITENHQAKYLPGSKSELGLDLVMQLAGACLCQLHTAFQGCTSQPMKDQGRLRATAFKGANLPTLQSSMRSCHVGSIALPQCPTCSVGRSFDGPHLVHPGWQCRGNGGCKTHKEVVSHRTDLKTPRSHGAHSLVPRRPKKRSIWQDRWKYCSWQRYTWPHTSKRATSKKIYENTHWN